MTSNTIRTTSLSAALLLSSCTASAGLSRAELSASAPHADAAREVEPAKVEGARPCEPDSDAYRAAQAALDALDTRLAALGPQDDPGPVNDEMEALLTHECLTLAPAPWSFERAHSVESLQQFWDHGGHKWLRDNLELLVNRQLSFPPSMRATLTLESRPAHPLAAELLCSSDDPDCGRETTGWRRRADHALRELVPRMSIRRGDELITEALCAERAFAAPPAERFTTLRDCLDLLRTRTAALPLGRTRALERGWLLVRGRRGHYSFCDEVRLYELASGAAYLAQSCGRPASSTSGPTHSDELARGYVPVDNLREAAWMMVMSPQMQERVYPRGESFTVPDGIELVGEDLRGGGYGTGGSWSSAQTRLTWSLMIDGDARAFGELTWPTDYDHAGQAHAVELLAIAEAGFVPGCPRVKPPHSLELGDPHERELFAAITKLGKQRPEKGCYSR